MNAVYSLPLHGVACLPFCSHPASKVAKSVELAFASVLVPQTSEPIWQLLDETDTYQSKISLFEEVKDKQTTRYVLDVACQGTGKIEVNKNSITLDWQKEGTGSHHYIQTLGIALWLELQKVLCIHANALSYGEGAVALIAPSRTGKTTLTAAMCKQGFSMMTDDMMAVYPSGIGFDVFPSWPIARMWPDSLANEAPESNKGFEKVHEKFAKRIVPTNADTNFSFCDEKKQLTTIYLLNRVDNTSGECEINAVSPSRAAMLLLQNSILGSAYRAIGIEKERIQQLSSLLAAISFKEISYSSGFDNLENVVKHMRRDLKR